MLIIAMFRMSKKRALKWSADTIIQFLEIYQKHEALWNTADENFLKKNARAQTFNRLVDELLEAGFEIADAETLKRKIKCIKDTYRIEAKRVERSKHSGASDDDIHIPKLAWFEKADAFLKNSIIEREFFNLVNT